MKIAMLAPFEESVPPKKYGGTEVVIYNLITELVSRGHDVTLFGTGDSNVPCKLVSIFPSALRSTAPYSTHLSSREGAKYYGISLTLSELQNRAFDIVHNHNGWRLLLFHQFIHNPLITTLHMPTNLQHQQIGYQSSSDLEYVSISNNQRKGAPKLQYKATVYNGIDLSLYSYLDVHDDYLLFLARFSPDKGAKEAIEIAKKAGRRLLLATKEIDRQVDSADWQYFESCKPMIDGSQIVLLGELDLETKVKYLQQAYALLAPIQWDEPFGLYAVEAMACGTPVIGVSRGSFPEIIRHGETGFLGKTVEELASYVPQISGLARLKCRRWVEERFSKEKMADGYLKVYERILGDKKA